MRNAARWVMVGVVWAGGAYGQTATNAPATAPTTAPVAQGIEARVQTLIRQLSDDSYQVRQEAQDQLVRFGAEAIPFLQKSIAATQDPEARTRAEAAVAQIEEDRASGPSLVTIRMKDAKPEEVLKELSRQGMYTIPTMPENPFKQEHMKWPAVTMEIDREPFLKAMRTFCEKTNLRPNAMGNDRRFVLMQGGDDSMLGPAVYPGAFMVVANSVTRSASINFARDKGVASKNLNLQVSFFAEPKLNIMGHDYHLQLTEAIDDNGNSLVLPAGGQYSSMGQDPSARWTLSASLQNPENLGTKLVRLAGVNRVLMQTRSETWEIPEITSAPSPSKSIAGRRYMVEEFKAQNADTYTFKFTMIREVARSEQWQQFGRGVRVTLLDAEGKNLSPRGCGGGGSDEKITHTYTFSRDIDGANGAKTGPAAKMVVEVPTEVKETLVSFEFKDLPLP